MGALTGAGTRVNWIREDSFTTAVLNPTPKVPGANATLDTAEATNNGTRIYLPASRTAVDIKAGSFDGAWAISGALTNPWWLETIYGSPNTTDNGDGTYTHTFEMGEPTSFQILEGYETSTTAERALKGCVPARAVFDPSVGEDGVVPFTWEGFYATESVDTDVSLTSQDTLDHDEFDYSDAQLDVDGTEQAIVQNASVELVVDPVEGIDAFGSRFAIDYVAGAFNPVVDYTKVKRDADALQQVYGGTTSMQEEVPQAPLTLDFDNGKAAGSGKNQVTFNGTGSFAESYGEEGPPGDPTARIDENLNRMLEDISVDATNETATPP
jgi:hypothetical protein